MKAAIVSIGNELLNGQTIDTNTAWLAQRLFETGIAVVGGWTVPDEISRILSVLQEAEEAADVILITGGLGPTDDDLTRQAVAEYLGVELEFHQDILDTIQSFFTTRGREMAEKNRSQAYAPAGCDILENLYGTAPGFWCQTKRGFLAAMPGVPAEMKRLFDQQVLSRMLHLHTDETIVSGKVRIFGPGESTVAQKLDTLMDRNRNPIINCTCGSGEILLHIVAKANDLETGRVMVEQDKKMLTALLGDWVYGYDNEPMAAVVGSILRENKHTIATAESCTGGLIAKMLTDCPGSSDYFLAGWVTYSNDAKIRLLGVPEHLIQTQGAVSESVARELAVGAAKKSKADVAISVTGIAGPGGGTDQKPVGLVYIGLSAAGKCTVQEHRFPSTNRDFIRKRAALAALNMIRLQMRI